LLSGIGPVYAERITEYRPFCSVDDLLNVPGIGEVTLSNIKEQGLVYVNPPQSCFEEEAEEEIDEEDILQRMEEIRRRIEELKEKTNKREESEEKEEETEEELEEEDEEEEEENEFEGCSDGQININSADSSTLTEITQIGTGYAGQIIELREEEFFWSLDDLDRVSGIAEGGSRLNSIIEEDLACVAHPDDDSFEPFEKEEESSSGGGGSGGGGSSDDDENDDEDDDDNDDDNNEENEENEEEGEEEDDTDDEDEEGENDEESGDEGENAASKEDLQKIMWVGEATADNIIDYRSNNPFCLLDDLVNVSGIGESKLNDIKEEGFAYVDAPSSCFDDGEDEDEEVSFDIEEDFKVVYSKNNEIYRVDVSSGILWRRR